MLKEQYEIVIIGGGPAGLAAAISAHEKGCNKIVILERDNVLGGILNQCIHNGFGLHTFGEELTGPEYAERYINKIHELNIEFRLNSFVVDINSNKIITVMNRDKGLCQIDAKSIVLAMGCRERPRGALNIPGYRPAGIYSAGTAQRFVNMEGFMPGRDVVILGSGDIGLIMARRMTLEGANVKLVAEIMPQSGGLKRNISQCLDDFNIPLRLNYTVIDIEGKDRVSGVTIAKVDDNLKPIPGTEEHYNCDTLLLSVGLIPENELSISAGIELDAKTNGAIVNETLETSLAGVFSCGNALHVHDLVDNVSEEASKAGANAANFVKNGKVVNGEVSNFDERKNSGAKGVSSEPGIREITCIGCPNGCNLVVKMNDNEIEHIDGYKCKKGETYARKEITNPTRIVTSSVKLIDSEGNISAVSVKTESDIPKAKIFECIESLKGVCVDSPVKIGDIIVENIADTGINVIATKNA